MKIRRPTKSIKRLLTVAVLAVLAVVIAILGPFGSSPLLAAQFGRPISDITSGGFTPTPIWSKLNETSPDGTTSEVTVASNGGSKTAEVLLSPLTNPLSTSGHIMSIYAKKSSNRSSTITFYLYQGTTLIATSATTSLTTTYTQYDYTLTSTEAGSISDYTNLRIRATFADGGGGAPGTFNYSWAQLQVPDPPNFNQFGFRWRSDDGNETSGTSLAAQNTTGSTVPNTVVRLRFSINNTGGDQTYSYRLEYNNVTAGVCAGSGWLPVPTTAGSDPFNMAPTSNYSDQAASTNVSSGPGVLTDPGGSAFSAGKLVKATSNTATSVALAQNKFTEIEYALEANSNANQSQYCFRLTNAGTPLNTYSQIPYVTISYPPDTPVVYSVANGATNASVTPTFQFRSREPNGDYVRYVLEICPANSWPCASGGITYDQTSSQTCWAGQDAQSGTAYQGNALELNSTMATCTIQAANQLSRSTQYYFRVKATDPGGSGLYTSYSSVNSFTTAALEILIRGGTCLGGVGSSCTSGSGSFSVKLGN
jgi:hypothetical protein